MGFRFMTTQIAICNRALVKLGAAEIMGLEDDSKSARIMRALYSHYLLTELSAYRWSFAISRLLLPRVDAAPVFGYQNLYMLPHDYLSLIEVGGVDVSLAKNIRWEVEQRQLLTDLSAPLQIRYVRAEGDVSKFSPLFKEAFSCRLALEGCEALTQSNTKKQLLLQDYDEAIRKARMNDAIEKMPEKIVKGEWLNARA